jgi:CheY-like chemotaxis protein
MDVQMLGMDGLAATRAIRRREASLGGHVRIVAMTAYARCLEAGMDSYIPKPVRRIDLARELAVAAQVSTDGQPYLELSAIHSNNSGVA